jgi:thiamine biosynthesis lipoprotein
LVPFAQRARPLLGTIVAIRIQTDAALAEPALAAAFSAIQAVHRTMSFHDPNSELSRLNRDATRAPQAVSASLWRVLRASLVLARLSEGRFDPSVAARLVQWGQLPAPVGAMPPDAAADWQDVELLPDRRVRFRKPLWLDFGGIAKGYAIDRAIAVLRAHDVRAGIVNAGGDLRVIGTANETIHVRDPADPTRTRALAQLREGAVATSAGYFSARNGRTALVDMRRGVSLGKSMSVSVCAPRALWADALTKVVLADADAARPLLRRLQAQAVLLDRGGQIRHLP